MPSSLALIYGLTKTEVAGENVPKHHSEVLNRTLANSTPAIIVGGPGQDPESLADLESRLKNRGNGQLSHD